MFILVFGLVTVHVPSFAVEEMTEQEIIDSQLEDEPTTKIENAYINDIEILGANIVKPEYILKKIALKKGVLYDKEVMQQDLKTIYKLGYFTERMKAIPVKNPNGTISLKIIFYFDKAFSLEKNLDIIIS